MLISTMQIEREAFWRAREVGGEGERVKGYRLNELGYKFERKRERGKGENKRNIGTERGKGENKKSVTGRGKRGSEGRGRREKSGRGGYKRKSWR